MPYRRRLLNRWYVYVIVVVVATLVLTSTFLRTYRISSSSMSQTLLPGDYVTVNKLAYGIRNPFTGKTIFGRRIPKRGEVVAYRYPRDRSRIFLHRAVGLPGDLVEVRGGRALVNSQLLDEQYVFLSKSEDGTRFLQDFGPVQVPDGHLFVLGDNRFYSLDSRVSGFVPLGDVLARAQGIPWSWDGETGDVRWSRIGQPIH